MEEPIQHYAHWLKPPIMPANPTDDDLFRMTRWAVETGWTINPETAKDLLARHDALAAETDRLRTALATAEAREAEAWIAVADRLPDSEVDVLVYLTTGQFVTAQIEHERPNYWDTGFGTGYGVGMSTHWRPLPTAPKPTTCATCPTLGGCKKGGPTV